MVENLEELSFDIPDGVLDEIQQNIEHIIQTFDVPEENKLEVIKQFYVFKNKIFVTNR